MTQQFQNINNFEKRHDKIIVRKLRDMADRFKNSSKIDRNKILYRVFIRNYGEYEMGLTVIEPGKVNGEFFMTKGHRHEKPLSEVYILFSGRGKLLIEGRSSKVYDLKKGKQYIISGRDGHRLVNTGKTKLKVMTIYFKEAGRNYDYEFKRRFFGK